jgi:hypothetical protein
MLWAGDVNDFLFIIKYTVMKQVISLYMFAKFVLYTRMYKMERKLRRKKISLTFPGPKGQLQYNF